MTPAEVEDVATYYVMFFREPVGKYVLQVCRTLSCALAGAERVTEALAEKLGIKVGRDRCVGDVHAARVRVPRRLRPRADRDGQQRALAREGDARRTVAQLVDDLQARGEAALSGCHLEVER